MQNVQAVHDFSTKSHFSLKEDSYITLEDKMISAYAAGVQQYDLRKQHVLDLVNAAGSVSSPETLFAIQQQTADYNIEVSLISALTRKATGAVETLLRA
ncbi:type III secretion system inner rod subunit SctI [Rouxiella chamberiensis]|uniref:Type III secretion system inner rod subunit SctI n=1 Tax=Rouxiella chamberiensis TaxID=1513468 RepID=A0ABY7HTD8_9GAMM|nr:type III secretion system inner rod subunit SctI [Rouxiella chamberiensis]WAT02675.1 type III secretion system inner rod subunit SctI [Rouxiella chamberiensis]